MRFIIFICLLLSIDTNAEMSHTLYVLEMDGIGSLHNTAAGCIGKGRAEAKREWNCYVISK